MSDKTNSNLMPKQFEENQAIADCLSAIKAICLMPDAGMPPQARETLAGKIQHFYREFATINALCTKAIHLLPVDEDHTP